MRCCGSSSRSVTILDIDLDFFVTPTVLGGPLPSRRPPVDRYRPWPVDDVRRFVEERLCIPRSRSVKGRFFEEHSKVYDYLVGRGMSDIKLVHCDAHADLGSGDSSFRYILEDLLALPVEARIAPRCGGGDRPSSGNWITFLIAARRVASVLFVTPPQWDKPRVQDDLPKIYFKDQDPQSGIIALPHLRKNGWENWVMDPMHRRFLQNVISFEPEVPFTRIPHSDYHGGSCPDLVLVTHSPLYVPETADCLLEVLCGYLDQSD